MPTTMSTVLTVTDLTTASYKLAGFAAMVAGPPDGEVVLVSMYGGGGGRRSDPPPGRGSARQWRKRLEKDLRQEGQLLERQRQWCADRGVRCRAELFEDGFWPELVVKSAERSKADLILLGLHIATQRDAVPPDQMKQLAAQAPCPVSVVRLPPFWVF